VRRRHNNMSSRIEDEVKTISLSCREIEYKRVTIIIVNFR